MMQYFENRQQEQKQLKRFLFIRVKSDYKKMRVFKVYIKYGLSSLDSLAQNMIIKIF